MSPPCGLRSHHGIAGRVPYVYTALYEGGEHHPGVFLVGETPSRQLLPAMSWLRAERGVRRWCIVGNDYIWPRGTAAAAQLYAPLCDGRICAEVFVPLGSTAFAEVVRRVERHRADAVVMLLVGQDAVEFNRAFAKAGLNHSCRRLGTLMEENTLLASGAESTRGICRGRPSSRARVWTSVAATPGDSAPRADSQQSGGVLLRGHPPSRGTRPAARTLDVRALCGVADSVCYAGPRGEVRIARAASRSTRLLG